MVDCGSCATIISTVPESIVCDGPCGRSFHIKCVNISRSLLKQIIESSNLQFVCDACKSFTFRGISGHFTELKKTIAALSDALSLHSVKADQLANTTAKLTDVVAANNVTADKLAGTSAPIVWPRNPILPSSDPPSTNIAAEPINVVVGTCESNGDLGSVKAVEPRCLVVISQLHPTTTAVSVVDFVKNKLNLAPESNAVRATMLIQKGRNVSELDYISCKLSLTKDTYASIMNASIWPTGVTIRDFINYPRNNKRTTGHFLSSPETINLGTVSI